LFRDPIFADALSYEPARAAYAAWSAAWQSDALPAKQALMPPTMPARALPNLFMHEELGARFRCRLTGSELDHTFGSAAPGKYLDEMLSGEALESRVALLRRSLDERKALLFAGQLFVPQREHIQTRRLLLPVRNENSDGRLIIGIVWFPSGNRPRDAAGRESPAATLVAIEHTVQD
jgi:hypothetical protein